MTSIILELLVYNEIPHDIDNLFVTLKLNRALKFIDYEFIDIEYEINNSKHHYSLVTCILKSLIQ